MSIQRIGDRGASHDRESWVGVLIHSGSFAKRDSKACSGNTKSRFSEV
jgi:hypothetical protein